MHVRLLSGLATRTSPAMVRTSHICAKTALLAKPATGALEGALEGAQQSLQELGATALATASASAANGGASLWQLGIAFICGGLFVTTVVSALILSYMLGATNVAKAKVMIRLAVRRTWDIAVSMLGAASMALLRRRIPGAPCADEFLDEEYADTCPVEISRWREAWMILRAGLGKMRRTASEGAEALKMELTLYSAAVGVPGLVGFQYLVDKFTPLRLEFELRKALVDGGWPKQPDPPGRCNADRRVRSSPASSTHYYGSRRTCTRMAALAEVNIGTRRFELTKFTVGEAPPQLLAARLYDIGPDALGFDVDTSWESELVADIEAVPPPEEERDLALSIESGFGIAPSRARVPVTVYNFKFVGPVRVVVTDLQAEAPGFGAILLSFPAPPQISFDVRVAGADVTKVPFFRDELKRALQDVVADQLYWPRRVVVPAEKPGTIDVPLLSEAKLEELTRIDPLLRAEQGLANQSAVSDFLEELAESRSKDAGAQSAEFNINLGVLPDLRNITYAIGNLTGVDFRAERLSDLLAGNFSSESSLANFSTDTQLYNAQTYQRLLGDFGQLGEQLGEALQRELQLRAVAELGELGDFTVDELLLASRRRFEPDYKETNGSSAARWLTSSLGYVTGAFSSVTGSVGSAAGSVVGAAGLLGATLGVGSDAVDANATARPPTSSPDEARKQIEASTPWWRLGGGSKASNATELTPSNVTALAAAAGSNESRGRWYRFPPTNANSSMGPSSSNATTSLWWRFGRSDGAPPNRTRSSWSSSRGSRSGMARRSQPAERVTQPLETPTLVATPSRTVQLSSTVESASGKEGWWGFLPWVRAQESVAESAGELTPGGDARTQGADASPGVMQGATHDTVQEAGPGTVQETVQETVQGMEETVQAVAEDLRVNVESVLGPVQTTYKELIELGASAASSWGDATSSDLLRSEMVALTEQLLGQDGAESTQGEKAQNETIALIPVNATEVASASSLAPNVASAFE